MNNRIIKNNLEITGLMEDVEEVIDYLKTENGEMDFNKIIPLMKDKDDIQMDDYINAALNIYMINNKKINKEEFISTMKFVGITREKPYNFRELTQDEINVFKTKYKSSNMLAIAEEFINQVSRKAIFNGYMIREGNWGTGTQPINTKFHDNRIDFITYGNPPEKIISAISKKFPSVKIIYTYVYEIEEGNKKKQIRNKVTFKNGEKTENEIKNFEIIDIFRLITQNVTI